MTEHRPDSNIKAPTLSVVLPNYNHASYLSRALDALLEQSRPADDIIIVDDASTDNSREIIDRYVAKYQSVRLLVNEKNSGVIAALTRGLNAARSTYVYFAAADDFVSPGFFATGIAALEAHPLAGLFCGDMALIDGNKGNFLGARPPVRPRFSAGFISSTKFARLLRHNDNFILTGAALLRRDATNWAGGFDAKLSTFADAYLVRKIALTYGLYYAPQTCLTWCIFPDGASRTTSTNADRTRQVFEAIESRMSTDPAFPNWYWGIFARRWHFSISRLAVQEEPIRFEILADIGISTRSEYKFIKWTSETFPKRLARLIILGWLWYKLRPYSIIAVAITALSRSRLARLGSTLNSKLQK